MASHYIKNPLQTLYRNVGIIFVMHSQFFFLLFQTQHQKRKKHTSPSFDGSPNLLCKDKRLSHCKSLLGEFSSALCFTIKLHQNNEAIWKSRTMAMEVVLNIRSSQRVAVLRTIGAHKTIDWLSGTTSLCVYGALYTFKLSKIAR